MRATILASLAVFAMLAGAGAARAQSEVFASPFAGANLFSDIRNLTCYLSNVGARPARVRRLRIVGSSGSPVSLHANTCGDAENFTLAPRTTCYVGANFEGLDISTSACAALTPDAAILRGALEHRNRNGDTLRSIAMSPAGGDGTAGFQRVASAPIFGGAEQQVGYCEITNFGSTTALVRNVEIVRSDGRRAAIESDCPTGSQASLAPGASCGYSVKFEEMRDFKTDLQCRAEVTRKANLRGSMILLTGGGRVLNQRELR